MRALAVVAVLSACGGGETCPAGDRPRVEEEAAFVNVFEERDDQGDVLGADVHARFLTEDVAAHDEILAVGDCRLLRFDPCAYCAEPCEGRCLTSGTCSPLPDVVSAGVLTIAGLSEPVSVGPDQQGYDWDGFGPIFQDGVDVVVTAEGEVFPPFTITTASPAPLVLTNVDALEARRDRDLVIEWVPGDDPDARIVLRLFTRAGIGEPAPVFIACDAPDTGSLLVPQSMMDVYADPANWHCTECFFTQWIMRNTVVTQEVGSATLELRAGNRVNFVLPI